jgi:hypothetical protein
MERLGPLVATTLREPDLGSVRPGVPPLHPLRRQAIADIH